MRLSWKRPVLIEFVLIFGIFVCFLEKPNKCYAESAGQETGPGIGLSMDDSSAIMSGAVSEAWDNEETASSKGQSGMSQKQDGQQAALTGDAGEAASNSGEGVSMDGSTEGQSRLTLLAAGDNLIHTPIFEKAFRADGSYDFNPVYDNVRDFVRSYDLAVINQETIFVDNNAYVSSYPTFGTPQSMGHALVNAGFDIILSATNHTMDKGLYGLQTTMNFWKSNYPDITLLGIHETADDFNSIDYIEKNGIKLALFNYTYGLNGFSLPAGRPYLVDLLSNKAKFLNDVRMAEQEADLTVCFLHIGEEYHFAPTAWQMNYIQELAECGADLIICAHPHVIQPFGRIATSSGGSAVVFYSCGNFVCTQTAMEKDLGGLASVQIVKDSQGCRVDAFDFIPTFMHYNGKGNWVYLLKDYTPELAADHHLSLTGSRFTVEDVWNLWHRVVG